MDTSFRVLKLKTYNNKLLGNCEIEFTKDVKTYNEPFFSVLIGPNASGKSNILRAIINIFRELDYYLKNNGKRGNIETGNFEIEFISKGNKFKFSNLMQFKIGEKLLTAIEPGPKRQFSNTLLKNDKQIADTDLIEIIPNSILAVSLMLTDKFPVVSKQYPFYYYLGVRRENSKSTAGTRTYIRRTVELLISALKDPNFINGIIEILDFLELDKKLIIQYTPRYKELFYTGDLTVELFLDKFNNYQKYFKGRRTEPWGVKYFNTIKENLDLVNQIVKLLNNISVKIKSIGYPYNAFEYDVLKDKEIIEDYPILLHIDKLDLLYYPTLKLFKPNVEMDLEAASSGEVHIISAMISMLATIKQNALILIDEPEISLHPNWQIQYFTLLRKIFYKYKSCHFIIGTHSNLILSDLKIESSSVIALNRNRSIEAKLLDYGPYGWSVEDILYHVFNVRTARNYFLQQDLTELLGLISVQSKNKVKIIEIVSRLKEIHTKPEDPLNDIISEAENYINSSENDTKFD